MSAGLRKKPHLRYSMYMGKQWFVLPVYYDVASFKEVQNLILRDFPQSQFVILDDSAGQDKDIDSIRTDPSVTVIQPPFNLGHQRGLVFALRQMANQIGPTDIVVTLDSDGEDRPEDIADLFDTITQAHSPEHTVAVVERSKRRESLSFKLFYFFFKMGFYWLTGQVIRSGNFAAYHGSFLKKYINHPYFDLCYSSTLISLKINRLVIKKPRGVRLQGQSKMNLVSLIMHGIRMLMPFIDRIAIRSLIAFAGLFMLSGIFAVSVICIRLFTDWAIPGWASYLVTISMLASLVNLGNFLVLFSIFSQSQGLAMQRLEKQAGSEVGKENLKIIKSS